MKLLTKELQELAQSIVDKLDITKEQVDLLYTLIGKLREKLEYQRVKTLC